MELTQICEIAGIIGGIATFMAFLLGPMFYLGAKIDSIKDQIHNDMENFKSDIRSDMESFKSEIRSDIKDFYGRLCAIEEKNKK